MNTITILNAGIVPADPFPHRTVPRLFLALALFLLPGFALRAQFITVTNANTITIAGYSGNARDLVIPNAIGGLPVVDIASKAFGYQQGLVTVTIPNGVTNIGDLAFTTCYALTNVSIPGSVLHIGDSAFADCVNLVSLTVPTSVVSIGDRAFAGCIGLTNVTIPNRRFRIRRLLWSGPCRHWCRRFAKWSGDQPRRQCIFWVLGPG